MTRILSDIELGDSRAAEQLLPLVYDEVRKLAPELRRCMADYACMLAAIAVRASAIATRTVRSSWRTN